MTEKERLDSAMEHIDVLARHDKTHEERIERLNGKIQEHNEMFDDVLQQIYDTKHTAPSKNDESQFDDSIRRVHGLENDVHNIRRHFKQVDEVINDILKRLMQLEKPEPSKPIKFIGSDYESLAEVTQAYGELVEYLKRVRDNDMHSDPHKIFLMDCAIRAVEICYKELI